MVLVSAEQQSESAIPYTLLVGLVARSCPTLVTPWTVARQAALSMGLSRQEYWSALPCPSPTSYIYIPSFMDFFSIEVTTELWAAFPVIYNRFSLVTYFIRSVKCLYVHPCLPIHPITFPPFPSCDHTSCSPLLCLYFCFAKRFICAIFRACHSPKHRFLDSLCDSSLCCLTRIVEMGLTDFVWTFLLSQVLHKIIKEEAYFFHHLRIRV